MTNTFYILDLVRERLDELAMPVGTTELEDDAAMHLSLAVRKLDDLLHVLLNTTRHSEEEWMEWHMAAEELTELLTAGKGE